MLKEVRCATMDTAQKDNWTGSIKVDQGNVIEPNSCEQVGMAFVLDGRRSCAVVRCVELGETFMTDIMKA